MTPRLRAATASLACLAFAAVSTTEAGAQPPAAPPPPKAAPAAEPPPPPGAQGGYSDPALQPPPGYSAQDADHDASAAERAYDQGYAAAAEQWSTANCMRQEQERTAAGAIIGGVLGAVIGSGVAGRGAHGAGALVGGGLGATAGGLIANGQGPGCPPGFTLREGAPAFAYTPAPAAYPYAAPSWYNPWLWYDGRWVYRPYPYHRYWNDHYARRFR